MSDIEQQFAISIVWFIALLITFGAGAAGLAILGDYYGWWLLGWWRRRRNAKGERTEASNQECLIASTPWPATPRKGTEWYPETLSANHARTARIVMMRPEVPEDQFDLLEIDDVHRSGWRCPQGMRVIHGWRHE